jgi:hypothetical protein
METAVVVAVAHVETVVAVVAEAEADVAENRGSGGGVDSDGGGNIDRGTTSQKCRTLHFGVCRSQKKYNFF